MCMRSVDASKLSNEARLSLACGVPSLDIRSLLTMQDEAITVEFMQQNGVTANNIIAAGMAPCQLFDRGCDSPQKLRDLGFDSLHLRDPRFSTEAVACFGAVGVREVFMRGAADAVNVSGSCAVEMLGITPSMLTSLCAGAPYEMGVVLSDCGATTTLSDITVQMLLDTGLRANTLMQLGISIPQIVECMTIQDGDLQKLGFSLTVSMAQPVRAGLS